MSHYPPTLVRLIKELSKLPGIGEKTAERLAMHLLKAPQKDAMGLAEAIRLSRENMGVCSRCFGLSDAPVCHLCGDANRNAEVLCVVEHPADLIAIEKSGGHRGLYHVLQGALSPIDGVGPENLRVAELLARARSGEVREVILATSTSVEGDATAVYLSQALEDTGVRVTRIATGVPVGGDLKYIDGLTLKRAMDSRRNLE